jgi:putative RNA polymerase, sigma 28 subunit, fliA/whiG subfamily
MTAKEYLNQLLNLERLIEAKRLECERLDAMSKKVSSTLSDCKVETSHDNDKTAVIVIQVIELKKDIREQMEIYLELQEKISKEIDAIGDVRYRSLLIMRYITGLKFGEISEKMNYGTRWVLVLHREALKEFDRLHGERYCA